MVEVSIHHRTSYRYQELVTLSPHRMMLRPRESRELRLRSHDLSIVPEAQIKWSHDVFGNAVATAFFHTPTDSVLVESVAAVELTSEQWPVFDIDVSVINYPFVYADRDYTDLGALTTQQHVDVDDTVRDWAQGFIAASPTDTLSLLKISASELLLQSPTRAEKRKALRGRCIRSSAAGARAGISRYSSPRPCVASASVPASCPVTCSTPTTR